MELTFHDYENALRSHAVTSINQYKRELVTLRTQTANYLKFLDELIELAADGNSSYPAPITRAAIELQKPEICYFDTMNSRNKHPLSDLATIMTGNFYFENSEATVKYSVKYFVRLVNGSIVKHPFNQEFLIKTLESRGCKGVAENMNQNGEIFCNGKMVVQFIIAQDGVVVDKIPEYWALDEGCHPAHTNIRAKYVIYCII